jgi:hypothetical protein
MDRMIEKMAQTVAPVKTIAWGGLHGSLALVLDNADYATITKNIVTLLVPLTKPTMINPKINKLSNPNEILTLQEEMKTLQKEFKLQEAVTTIGVQCIIDSVEEQYVKELNKDYFGYANQTIKMLLTHLCTNWCKVMTKERTNATEAFYWVWIPLTTHIISFGCQLNKQQTKCKNINVILLEEAKTLHCVGQMYKSNYYTKKQMTKYKMQTDVNKTWLHTLQFLPNFLPNARHTETTMRPIAALTVRRTSMTSQPIAALLGWEIWLDFYGIPRVFRFRTFSSPEFSSEFHFFNRKICSRQFGTRSNQFGILSCH